MASQASWYSGALGRQGEASADKGLADQHAIEDLLRRLVHRVETSERHYSEALDDLHARLGRLSQQTDPARAAGDAVTFERLHDQLSSLARRLEREASTPLDDFERLGRALAGGLDQGASGSVPRPAPFPSPFEPGPARAASAPFNFSFPEAGYAIPPLPPLLPDADRDLDKRLVEAAHRLERSVGAAMTPQLLDALNARLDEIGRKVAEALDAAPKPLSLDPIERQISDMAQQLGRAEAQLAKVGEIEDALHRLIARVDSNAAELGEVAAKAANEAARLVAGELKRDAANAERLDAMHRDLVAMNERSRASEDRLAGTVEAVHESLKQLVQQLERNAASSLAPKAPLAERMRDLSPQPERQGDELPATSGAKNGGQPNGNEHGGDAGAKQVPPRSGTGAPLTGVEETEAASRFGRAWRGRSDAEAVDLDERPRRILAKKNIAADADDGIPDDLVAAARRAAQAAALKAAERTGGFPLRRMPPYAGRSAGAETPRVGTPRIETPRVETPLWRGRSLLIVCAAILLALSAVLLYGRLQSKFGSELMLPGAEQSAPLPSAPSQTPPLPGAGEGAPAPAPPKADTAPAPSPSGFEPDAASSLSGDAAIDTGENVTEIAKQSYWQATVEEETALAEPAALKPTEAPALPPGVVFFVEDPALGH